MRGRRNSENKVGGAVSVRFTGPSVKERDGIVRASLREGKVVSRREILEGL